MAEPTKKIATRQAYGEALAEFGAQYPNLVVMDADLSASTKTALFKAKFPERFLDCGIAEADLMSSAAGIATTGKVVFASTFAMFAAGRAYEQVRNSIGYPHLNVKIGATHAGISVGEDGATHQCVEDLALMRVISGMTVVCPSDAVEARLAVKTAIEHDGPFYLRFGRLPVPVLNDRPGYSFELGKGVVLRQGNDVTLAATGLMVAPALDAAELLQNEGIAARVINIHTIKPIDDALLAQAARETGAVVTAEEHSVIGGLGGAVCESLAQSCPVVPVLRVGMNDCFGKSGKPAALLEHFGLTAQNIAAHAKKAIALKH